MEGNPQWLLDHASNCYSQAGEDGVLAKILSLLPDRNGWCVEFGAWDGIHLSNVRRLILEDNYRAILIERDPQKYASLERNYAQQPQVTTLRANVGFGPQDGLDQMLAPYPIPRDFDFLSIDIDGNDYHVWRAIQVYRPKVVCIEFNHTIPTEVNFVQPPASHVHQGSSLLALDHLARANGYQMVCVLPWNALFVDERYFPAFGISDNRPAALRRDQSAVTWIFAGFDGSIHLAGASSLPWHGIYLEERDLQVLPRSLRRYPPTYARWRRACFRLWRSWRRLRGRLR